MNHAMNIVGTPSFTRPSCANTEGWCITAFMSPSDSDAHSLDTIDTRVPQWEGACIAQLDQGKPEAFNPLVHFYSARIYAHLYRMTGNREEAEDLTQETFVRAYRKINHYDRSRPFRNWLYTIATNIGRNAARARGRRIPSVKEDTTVEISDTRATALSEQHELKDQVAQAVNQLPDPLPLLIQLHYQEGFTIREAAQVLGMKESAAKVALHRARKTLRTMLTKEKF